MFIQPIRVNTTQMKTILMWRKIVKHSVVKVVQEKQPHLQSLIFEPFYFHHYNPRQNIAHYKEKF